MAGPILPALRPLQPESSPKGHHVAEIHPARKYVITGSASGIGQATVSKLRSQGHQVFGVDLRDAEIITDLSTAEGRASLVAQAQELSGGVLDGVISVAGLNAPRPITAAVNYFGAVATLEGLRPLLAASAAPRAAVTASLAVLD